MFKYKTRIYPTPHTKRILSNKDNKYVNFDKLYGHTHTFIDNQHGGLKPFYTSSKTIILTTFQLKPEEFYG